MVEEIREEPQLIEGGIAYDDRGSISFFNEFNFPRIKRFYQVENLSPEVIRAFHGHLQEEKYLYLVQGCAKIICARIEEGKKLSSPSVFVIDSNKPMILRIPKSFVNGFRALKENTSLIFFSTSTLEESKQDDFRFAWDYFGKEIWETKNR